MNMNVKGEKGSLFNIFSHCFNFQVLYTTMFWITLRQYVQEVVVTQPGLGLSAAAALQPFSVAMTTTSSGEPLAAAIDGKCFNAFVAATMHKE